MKVKWKSLWERVRTSYWFVPSLMTLLAVALASVVVEIEQQTDPEIVRKLTWVFAGSAEGARAVLSTIAGSMITVAGVAFSVTIVSLVLASQQFGPRILRSFMRDLGNQIVLGTFIATFIYCLLVLRVVHGTDNITFIPHIGVTVGVALAILSVCVLIFFIHHVSYSIQANNIVAAVNLDLRQSIDRLFPEKLGHGSAWEKREEELAKAEKSLSDGMTIEGQAAGYVQGIDTNTLMETARSFDLLIRLDSRPGDFVIASSPLVTVDARGDVEDEVAEQIRGCFVVGNQRTSTQDVEFAMLQLVEVAVRALSPGVNDPFTAITCVHRLAEALGRLAGRAMPSPYRHDEGKRLRVIAPVVTFPEMVAVAFDQIRQHSRSSTAVETQLLTALAMIAPHIRRPSDRQALMRQATLIRDTSPEATLPESERNAFQDRVTSALRSIADAAPRKTPHGTRSLDAGI